MSTITQQKILRVLDANWNRAKEGLRVCEDIARFCWDDDLITKGYKNLRHQLSVILQHLPLAELLGARNIEEDVGKPSISQELKREDVTDIYFANSQRCKESLRVLEEFLKLIQPEGAQQVKQLRYQLYALEKDSNVYHHRMGGL
jgi:thiamine-phosphate pyrophosphorylase